MEIYEIRRKFDMKQVAEDYGIDVSRSGNILCPFHDEKTPSMKLYDDHYHCFGCGEHGDVIDFVSKMENISKGEAISVLKRRYSVEEDIEYNRLSVLKKLEKAEHEKEIEYFTRVLTKYIKLKERFLEENEGLPVSKIIQTKIDIDNADGIFDMLMKTDYKNKYDFIQGFKDSLKEWEHEIVKDNIVLTRDGVEI